MTTHEQAKKEPPMSDAQRMREQFREWADSGMRYVTDRRNDGAYVSTAADDAWEGFRAGQLARDAEVQALREALESIHYRATRWEVLPTVEAHQSVLQDIGEDARAALAGEEATGG